MFRKLFAAAFAAALLCVAIYGALVAHNNHSASPPSQEAVRASWEKSIGWLQQNRTRIMADKNPILWWMIGESAKATGDARLQVLYDDFVTQYRTVHAQSIWNIFFDPSPFRGANLPAESYESFADYQQFFLFSLSCGTRFMESPVIAAQVEVDFCPSTHPLSPACATHQLMGYRFLQRIQCDRVPQLEDRIASLQSSIRKQLTWDPRVVDVYVQRVLMLVDSGAYEQVEPRWLQRVLDAQLADGSWSNLQPLVPLGGDRYFGFDAKLIGAGPVRGNFHATAQGVWLTSLLLKTGTVASAQD